MGRQIIYNGDFSLGLSGWSTPEGNAFSAENGYIKATSSTDGYYGLVYCAEQAFTIQATVNEAKISAQIAWSCPSGNQQNGTARFNIVLIKPNSQSIVIYDSGWCYGSYSFMSALSDQEISYYLNEVGTYKLRLYCEIYPAYSTDSGNIAFDNYYPNWDNHGFDYYSNYEVYKQSGYNFDPHQPWIQRSFTIPHPASSASLTVKLKGIYYGDTDIQGECWAVIKLVKPNGSEVVLYNSTANTNGEWVAVLNNTDISYYLNQAGTYYLILQAYVKSSADEDGEGGYIFFPTSVHFGEVGLFVSWQQSRYSASYGYYDSIGILLSYRYSSSLSDSASFSDSKDEVVLYKRTLNDLAQIYESLFEALRRQVRYWLVFEEVMSVRETLEIKTEANLIKSDVLSFAETISSRLSHVYKVFTSDSLQVQEKLIVASVKSQYDDNIYVKVFNLVLPEYKLIEPVKGEWEVYEVRFRK